MSSAVAGLNTKETIVRHVQENKPACFTGAPLAQSRTLTICSTQSFQHRLKRDEVFVLRKNRHPCIGELEHISGQMEMESSVGFMCLNCRATM